MERKTIVCECFSSEHQFHFIHDPEDDTVYLETHLVQYNNFFKRLWIGLKYAFGYKCRYGNFDCTIVPKEEKKKLVEFLAKSDLSVV